MLTPLAVAVVDSGGFLERFWTGHQSIPEPNPPEVPVRMRAPSAHSGRPVRPVHWPRHYHDKVPRCVSNWMPATRAWKNQQVQIWMLGPFDVRTDDGGSAGVPGARLRGLLVALALKPGAVVSKAALIDWIWGEQPPADATNALQRLASRLRKSLPDGVVEGQVDGYRLRVEPDDVDAVRFERLVAAGSVRAGQDPRRVELLREALGL